ncbi:hypothetical protein VTN77DRAFT_2253 [Rasamsonia byssochlamydoides]|uniref:uncharacterized protein n=1 Tax=Rasamsonia byssochlamydoides TaxID=89139 RepID=UPI00374467E9
MPPSPSSSTHSVVAGSTPPSPTTMTSTKTDMENGPEQATPVTDNLLDDIFGSSPPGDGAVFQENIAELGLQPDAATTVEPSDLPSLRRQHVTAGYRDGVSFSKSQHVQRGFDAGFPVGAQFGLRVGTVLGILEGVLKGLETRPFSGPVKKRNVSEAKGVVESEVEREAREKKIEKVRQLYRTAVKELSVESVFGNVAAREGGSEEEEKPEIQLARKAEAVVSKWEKKVAVSKWEENMESLEEEQGDNSGEPS